LENEVPVADVVAAPVFAAGVKVVGLDGRGTAERETVGVA